jgi:predicted RNA-binding protein with PUA-like domain
MVKFSIDDLKEKGKSPWDGVRNYEARNLLRDHIKVRFFFLMVKKGDLVRRMKD